MDTWKKRYYLANACEPIPVGYSFNRPPDVQALSSVVKNKKHTETDRKSLMNQITLQFPYLNVYSDHSFICFCIFGNTHLNIETAPLSYSTKAKEAKNSWQAIGY